MPFEVQQEAAGHRGAPMKFVRNVIPYRYFVWLGSGIACIASLGLWWWQAVNGLRLCPCARMLLLLLVVDVNFGFLNVDFGVDTQSTATFCCA